MKKTMWEKLKSSFTRAGESQMECADSLSYKESVNEEYSEAFRTKSYVEMWSKAQDQLGNASFNGLTSTFSLSFYVRHSEYLLEPQQETLMKKLESLLFHYLLVNYFEASLEAYSVCQSLLRSVHQTRVNYQGIQRAIKLSEDVHDCCDSFRHLAAFASLKNPLSVVQLCDYHHSNMLLFASLKSKGKKIRRRVKLKKLSKKVGAYSLVNSQSAVLSAMLIFLMHSMVGIVAAPGLIASLVFLKRKIKVTRRPSLTSLLERFAAQLDVAAKGVYILINDFDTISRMAMRLQDEVEHC